MTILRNCELWHPRLDPKRPNSNFNKENPTWELQIRTTDKEQKKQWEEEGLKVVAVVPDEEGAKPFWRVNLRKKSIKSDKTAADPVELVDARQAPIDANTIGNGSIGHVRLFQYDFEDKKTKAKGRASVLMGVQVVKHILYKSKPREGFRDEGETSVVQPPVTETAEDDIPY